MDTVYKGFSHLSGDCHFDIDRDVLTTHCRSSLGDSVDSLSRTIIIIIIIISDTPITNNHGGTKYNSSTH